MYILVWKLTSKKNLHTYKGYIKFVLFEMSYFLLSPYICGMVWTLIHFPRAAKSTKTTIHSVYKMHDSGVSVRLSVCGDDTYLQKLLRFFPKCFWQSTKGKIPWTSLLTIPVGVPRFQRSVSVKF